MKQQKKRKIKWILPILLLVILLGIIVFLAMKIFGQKAMLKQTTTDVVMTAPETEEVVVEDDGVTITYNGEKYVYNENITSVLCMGVDKSDLEEDDLVIGSAGQADMLMLAIMDTESGKVNLWNISRDSMTEVDIYNVNGEYVKTEEMQACLAFAYGDGKHGSCENTVKAVSRLLYGMPIQSYAVLDIAAIQPLNDAIGGVEVMIHEEDILHGRFKPGEKVLLMGDDVTFYVSSRRTEIPGEPIDSNNNRMARQRQYMMNFIQKVMQKTKEDISTPLNLFSIVKKNDHIITNLDTSRIAYLTTLVTKVDFSEDSFRTVPGEVVAGEKHAEYHVDDEALYQMILDTFYVKAE